jgi:beta-galactosidase
MVFAEGEGGLNGRYACGLLCDVLHLEGAQVRATFGQDYYAGSPSLT